MGTGKFPSPQTLWMYQTSTVILMQTMSTIAGDHDEQDCPTCPEYDMWNDPCPCGCHAVGPVEVGSYGAAGYWSRFLCISAALLLAASLLQHWLIWVAGGTLVLAAALGMEAWVEEWRARRKLAQLVSDAIRRESDPPATV